MNTNTEFCKQCDSFYDKRHGHSHRHIVCAYCAADFDSAEEFKSGDHGTGECQRKKYQTVKHMNENAVDQAFERNHSVNRLFQKMKEVLGDV